MSDLADSAPSIPRRLVNRRAIVTGAGAGIGRAIATRLGAEGAQVMVADLDKHAAQTVAHELGPPAVAQQVDQGRDPGPDPRRGDRPRG
jgi:NAD(P)-dependent dehydrogenase (short-subunit alcohol dehydrogenase family)